MANPLAAKCVVTATERPPAVICTVTAPDRPPSVSRPRTRAARPLLVLQPLLALALLLGVVAWYGSNRQPVDATAPIVVRGEVPSPTAGNRFRVGTFNIHGGRGNDRWTDLDATAAVMSGENLDLVGIYEAYGSWTNDQARELGNRMGLASVFAATERRWWHDHFGNGLLIGRPVRQVVRITLPGTQGKRFRNALLTTFDAGGSTVRVLSAHIDTETDRERQLAMVFELFRSLEAPAVLMGDLNCEIDHPQLADLLDEPDVVDAVATRVESLPEERIDHVLVRGLDVLDAEIIETNASDHPCVWAELALPAE